MRRRTAAPACLSLLAVILAGCVSLSGLDDGSRDAGVPDAERRHDAETDSSRADRHREDAAPKDAAGDSEADVEADGGDDGGDHAVCPEFAVFCDGFETGDLSRWDITAIAPPTSIVVESTMAHSGKDALLASSTVNGDGGTNFGDLAYAEKQLYPMGSGVFALRVYVWLEEGQVALTDIVQLGTESGKGDTLGLGFDMNGGLDVLRQASVDETKFAATIPTSRWVCLEWIVSLGTSGSWSVYVDGTKAFSESTLTLDSTAPPYDDLRLGYLSTAGTAAQMMYFDDVVLAKQRIGCE
jgi:hypothetical protein